MTMDGVDSPIGTGQHHFRRYQLLDAQDNPVLALDANHSTAVVDGLGGGKTEDEYSLQTTAVYR